MPHPQVRISKAITRPSSRADELILWTGNEPVRAVEGNNFPVSKPKVPMINLALAPTEMDLKREDEELSD
jgi:hypothetical protein